MRQMPASSSSDIERRIIELAFTPWDGLPEQLRRLGLFVQIEEGGQTITISNASEQMGTGLINSDPITKAVILAFALCGSSWASFFPNLLEKVDAEWKQRRCAKKSNA